MIRILLIRSTQLQTYMVCLISNLIELNYRNDQILRTQSNDIEITIHTAFCVVRLNAGHQTRSIIYLYIFFVLKKQSLNCFDKVAHEL